MRLIKIICFLLCSSFIFSTANAHDIKLIKKTLIFQNENLFFANPDCVKEINDKLSDEQLTNLYMLYSHLIWMMDNESSNQKIKSELGLTDTVCLPF